MHGDLLALSQIGIIGLITPDTKVIAAPGNIEFLDPAESLKQCITDMRAETAGTIHLVVALTHLGYDEDQALAAAVPDVDMVIGGHSHSFLHASHSDASLPKLILNPATGATDRTRGPYPTLRDSPGANRFNGKTAVATAFYATRCALFACMHRSS